MIEITKAGRVIAIARNEAEVAALLAMDPASVRGDTLPPTLEEYEAAIQGHVDAAARGRSYSDGAALAGYVASTVPAWSAEAMAFVEWRDAVWIYVHQELAKALAGERAAPAIDDFIAELPEMIWPE